MSDSRTPPNRGLVDGRRIAAMATQRVASYRESFTPREHALIEKRLFRAAPATLESLAAPFGISRERLRQIQARLIGRLEERAGDDLERLAAMGRERLDHVTTPQRLDDVVAELLPEADHPQPAVDLTRRMLKSRLDYRILHHHCLDRRARAVVETLRDAAVDISDDELWTHLPHGSWNEVFPQLVEATGLERCGPLLALRRSIAGRVKAAVVTIGRPATKEEIARAAGLRTRQIGSALARIRSIGRADKSRWGLREWLDEEYDGLPSLIERRIHEGGGSASLGALMSELPTKFGVSNLSVNAVARTPQFEVRGGRVRLADASAIELRPLQTVIHGRTPSGDPFWTFRVQERYLRGYSLAGLPPEIANELGAGPNGSAKVTVCSPAGCKPLSVHWRLTSVTGASLGYLSEPLRRLRVGSGDYVRLVLRGSEGVEMSRAHPPAAGHGGATS